MSDALVTSATKALFDNGATYGSKSVYPFGQYSAYELEIIQPQAGLDTKNRFYKQYPGLEYNVKLSVFGGRFDTLNYSLTTAPAGMTIDSATGVITWLNPIEAGSPHTITAEVTDGVQTKSVTWSLTVNTTNTIFVDSTVGVSGDGSIGSPFKLWTDFYGADKWDAAYQDYQVYFRAGTHVVTGNNNTANNGNTWRSTKPLVFLAYPGEAVTQDFSQTYMFYENDGPNTYFDGFNCINVGAHWAGGSESDFAFRLSGDNITFRRNTWRGIKDGVGSYNQSYIMATDQGVNKKYWSMSENDFDGNAANAYASLVAYRLEKSVFESNLVSNIGNIGIGWKTGNIHYATRGNVFSGGVASKNIWLAYTAGEGGQGETSWNYSEAAAGFPYYVNDSSSVAEFPVYAIRNTFAQSTYYKSTEIGGADFLELDNVVVSVDVNNYVVGTNNNPSEIVQRNNLVNASAVDFINTLTGELVGDFASQNSTKGCDNMAGLK